MEEKHTVIKIIKAIVDLFATTNLISGILVIIAMIQNIKSNNGPITDFFGVKIYGITVNSDYSQDTLTKLLFVLGSFCFIEALAGISLSFCLKKLLKTASIFSIENVKCFRRVGIFITLLFAIFISAMAIYSHNNEWLSNQVFTDSLMKAIYSISDTSLGFGVICILFSVFISKKLG